MNKTESNDNQGNTPYGRLLRSGTVEEFSKWLKAELARLDMVNIREGEDAATKRFLEICRAIAFFSEAHIATLWATTMSENADDSFPAFIEDMFKTSRATIKRYRELPEG